MKNLLNMLRLFLFVAVLVIVAHVLPALAEEAGVNGTSGNWLNDHWVGLVAAAWAFEKLLEAIGTLTGNKIVDNVGVMLGNLLKFFPSTREQAPAASAKTSS